MTLGFQNTPLASFDLMTRDLRSVTEKKGDF